MVLVQSSRQSFKTFWKHLKLKCPLLPYFVDSTIEHELAINDWVFNKKWKYLVYLLLFIGIVFWFCTPPVNRKWLALFLKHLKETLLGYDMYFWLISNVFSSLFLRFCVPHTLWNNHKSVAAARKVHEELCQNSRATILRPNVTQIYDHIPTLSADMVHERQSVGMRFGDQGGRGPVAVVCVFSRFLGLFCSGVLFSSPAWFVSPHLSCICFISPVTWVLPQSTFSSPIISPPTIPESFQPHLCF